MDQHFKLEATLPLLLWWDHRLNMELDLQSLFGSCVQLYSLAETPLPPHLGSYARAYLSAKIDDISFLTPGWDAGTDTEMRDKGQA